MSATVYEPSVEKNSPDSRPVSFDSVANESQHIVEFSERKAAERALKSHAARSERLKRITASIADAVTPDQVFEAIVDRVGAALDASTSALWVVKDSEPVAHLARATGYPDATRRTLEAMPLDSERSFPALDALKRGEPVWIASQEELLSRYPHLASVATTGRSYSIACLPICAQGRTLGALGFTFDDLRPLDEEERNFLLLVARYSGQALERLRLLELEQKSRIRAELLHGLVGAVIGARREEEVFEAALDAIEQALGTNRASILVFDSDGVMRFRAWRNLSESYRRAVEGHSPWSRQALNPRPIVSRDVATDPAMASYLGVFRDEGIGAVGFIPLVAEERLIGKFMVYYDRPRDLASQELELARAIANHVAVAVGRFKSIAELQQTVRFNEMFTGILGHDLRNPLAAMITAARMAMMRAEGDGLLKPLSRILTSGDRMARMISQLLDFTRVRVGNGIPLTLGRADLVSVLRQVMDELDDANPECVLRLDHLGDTFGNWDVDRLSQVFSNLVANAVQHGIVADGVEVTVEVTIDGRLDESVRVEVKNKGAIPPQILPTLFEPLAGGGRRLDTSRGLGLGLYITRELVRAHGGHIDVRSDEVPGTTIAVLLPREPPGG